MQDKPIRCAYAYATTQPIASNAIYQRGRYYVTDNTGKKDKYRYNIFFSDLDGNIHLLGLTGTIDNAKRYTNNMYHAMPMAMALQETQTEQAEKLGKKYRVRLRPEKKEKQVKSPREKTKAQPKPKAEPKPKPKAEPKPKPKAELKPKPKAQPKPKAEPKNTWAKKLERIKKMPLRTINMVDKALQAIYALRVDYMNSAMWPQVSEGTKEYFEFLKEKSRTIIYDEEYQKLYNLAINASNEKSKKRAQSKLNIAKQLNRITQEQYKELSKIINPLQQTRLF